MQSRLMDKVPTVWMIHVCAKRKWTWSLFTECIAYLIVVLVLGYAAVIDLTLNSIARRVLRVRDVAGTMRARSQIVLTSVKFAMGMITIELCSQTVAIALNLLARWDIKGSDATEK